MRALTNEETDKILSDWPELYTVNGETVSMNYLFLDFLGQSEIEMDRTYLDMIFPTMREGGNPLHAIIATLAKMIEKYLNRVIDPTTLANLATVTNSIMTCQVTESAHKRIKRDDKVEVK